MITKVKILWIFSSIYLITVASSKVSYCWHQKCSDCSDAMFTEIGIKEKCDLKSIISTTWLDSEDDNTLDIISNEHLIEFVCLKMIAYDPITDITDMIRGCTLNNTADHMCKVLAGLEEAKGRPIHDCSNCRHNLCNSSSKISHIYSILFIGTYLSLI